MMYPLVRELAAAAAPHRVPVVVTCRVLGLARQPYYRWLASPVTDSELAEAYRANALFDEHRDDPEFVTASFSTRPGPPVSRWPSGPPGGSARTTAGGVPWASAGAVGRTPRPGRLSMMIWYGGTSPQPGRTGCG